MKRVHLFELEDQEWFPTFLRNYGTDFLQFLANHTPMFDPIIPVLERTLKKSNTTTIVDLASGGGGGMLRINKKLKETVPEVEITLTDYYPNIPAFEYTKSQADNIDFWNDSVDARDVPQELQGVRTQFLSLHHFRPNDARQILQNAVNSGQSIAIFEGQERSFKSLLSMFFSPLSVLLVTPFIRPFRWGRLLFTYLIPILPFFIMWDGIVSSLRTYSVEEMNELIDSLDNKGSYDWEVKRIQSGPSGVLYLVGTKKPSES